MRVCTFFTDMTMEEAVIFNQLFRSLRKMGVGNNLRPEIIAHENNLAAHRYSAKVEPYDGPHFEMLDLLFSKFFSGKSE